MAVVRVCVVLGSVLWLWNRNGMADSDPSLTAAMVEAKQVIDAILDNSTYDRTMRPHQTLGLPTRVEIDVVLNTLGPVNELDMEMSASFYLRQQWQDPRLSYPVPLGLPNFSLPLHQSRLDSLWLPDTFFSQGKKEDTHDVTVPNLLFRLYPDGTILYSQRLSVTFQCLMDLWKFPLDKQECFIKMESYSHTTSEMYFAWSAERESMDILENAHIPDFDLVRITTHDCTAAYAIGVYPCLEARLKLSRQIGFYMTQIYIPSVLTVSLSWVSFWLDCQAIPARISVGLLTVLTITTQSSGVQSKLPRVPYIKSIDVWMSICLVFVFAAYMQYAFVTVFSRRHRKLLSSPASSANLVGSERAKASSADTIVSVNGSTENGSGDPDSAPAVPRFKPQRRSSFPSRWKRSSIFWSYDDGPRDVGRVVDKWSRILFPLTFAMFNVFYWVYYTQVAD